MGGPKSELPVFVRRDGEKFVVSDHMKEQFDKDGFIIVRNLFNQEEIGRLIDSLEADDSAMMKMSYQVSDGDGGKNRMILWNHPGEDYSGMMGRCCRVVDTCEALIGGEVYHYHTKMVLKDAHTGGAFQWHQDYGYWYFHGILRPDMISVQVSVDDADKGNGCLQVIRGSHKMGRIEHGRIGDQAGVDLERIEEASKVMEKVHIETRRGDALFFHCNLLHRSDQNQSDRRRWVYIACYNRADNNPYKDHMHARYTALKKVADNAVLACNDFTNMEGKWFINPTKSTFDFLPDRK